MFSMRGISVLVESPVSSEITNPSGRSCFGCGLLVKLKLGFNITREQMLKISKLIN